MQYRPYQESLHNSIFDAWASPSVKNVTAVLPTGGGKTVVMSGVLKQHDRGRKVAVAHRKELVGQIAMALGANGVRHSIIGPKEMVKYVIHRQRQRLGTHFFDANASVTVASVDTLIAPSRQASLKGWAEQVGLWVIDESHHVLEENKWGKAVRMFPNAQGLGFTATPIRADGKGLGRFADGVMDTLVEGPTMRELINQGFLCDYRIFAPLTYMPLSESDVGASGDYSHAKLKAAAKRSQIVGDVVKSLNQFARNKQTVVFATDLETAAEMASRYRQNGIRADVISGETKDTVRTQLVDWFESHELQVLITVDLLGEGFDCPGIEAAIFARPTESYGLYCQMFGRALRPLHGKPHAIIIDHVGVVQRHGLPDAPRIWTLDGREKRPRSSDPEADVPLRYCVECTQPYPRYKVECPWCGHYPQPDARGEPEFVDGDLFEISPEILRRLRGEIERIEMPAAELERRMRKGGMHNGAIAGATRNHEERYTMQRALRESMAWWAGMDKHKDLSQRELQRLFYHCFGVDVLTAQSLGRPEAAALANKINRALGGPAWLTDSR